MKPQRYLTIFLDFLNVPNVLPDGILILNVGLQLQPTIVDPQPASTRLFDAHCDDVRRQSWRKSHTPLLHLVLPAFFLLPQQQFFFVRQVCSFLQQIGSDQPALDSPAPEDSAPSPQQLQVHDLCSPFLNAELLIGDGNCLICL